MESGLSLREVASKTGIGWSDIGRMERGVTEKPSFWSVMKICEFFNIDPWDIKI